MHMFHIFLRLSTVDILGYPSQTGNITTAEVIEIISLHMISLHNLVCP